MKSKASLVRLLNLSVSLFLAVAVMIVLACMLVVTHLEENTRATTHSMQIQLALKDLRLVLRTQESQFRAFVLTGKTEFLEDWDQGQALRQRLDLLRALLVDNESELQALNSVSELTAKHSAYANKVVGLRRAGQEDEAQLQISAGEGLDEMTRISQLISQMEDVELNLLKGRQSSMQSTQRFLAWLLGLGLVVCVTLGAVLLFSLARRLDPLTACVKLATRIGAGDLSQAPLPVRVLDEVGVLAQALNAMLVNLRTQTQRTRQAADRLVVATQQIVAATRLQATIVEQQSVAVHETAVTMEVLGQSADQVVERAREVVARAETTSKAVDTGLKAVEESVRRNAATLDQLRVLADKILSLNQNTQTIGLIVTTVKELSERSNMVALNAAIQAASSAEGKAFAVVANEMKSLADQSKLATKQVRDLLGEIERGIHSSVFITEEAVKRGETGSVYTDQVHTTIRDLADNIQESWRAFQQIVGATFEQRVGFDHVNSALQSIWGTSDEASTMTRQLEAAGAELGELSEALIETMSSYRLDP